MTSVLDIQLENFSPAFSLDNSCHLWLLDLTQLNDAAMIRQQTVLSETELLRAKEFKRGQSQFIAHRAFVRLCLSRYTHTPPQSLQFATEPNGKPYLVDAALPIVFNLSHSQNMAVLAVGLQHAIGVDIESLKRSHDHRNIAERYFHPDEVAELKHLDDANHNRHFFKLWTLKEALFKATGVGISSGLEKAAFDLRGDDIHVKLAPELNTTEQEWQFYQTFVNENYCVALARKSHQALKVNWFSGEEMI